ncbi:proline dehydrogenase family protein [Halodesulfurarchaeum sp.]|uniref:proline dehydrogenase family protein n=1 Tax=Halodesulfurarchaeum sp. TaxID=1980530 RepID=UPI002FC36790
MIPPIANKFVAGESAGSAIDHVRQLNGSNVKGIINHLGEHYPDTEQAAADRDEYFDLIGALADTAVESAVSVKPSQIGMEIDEKVFRENLQDIVALGAERDVFVWVDMEDHTTVQATLDAYVDFAREHPGMVGVCLQSNLKRTREDLERVGDVPGKIRLVKGAYDEPSEIAYRDKAQVNKRYRADLEYMFREFDESAGIAVGSHDMEMVDYAIDLGGEHVHDFETQMLMGVRGDKQKQLASQGIEVYQYVPYGNKWFSYFFRRARERKENMLFALRAVLE